MTSKQEVIALQTWWLGEVKKITGKVIREEDGRQERAKAKSEDMLADYRSQGEILDAYGMGCITARQKDRLMDLWEKREAAAEPGRLYKMKIQLLTEMYETAKQIIKDTENAMRAEE